MLSNKPFLIWLLTTPPHLKYVATLPCNLSLMACFADINVSQGSVATYAKCDRIFDIHLTANLPRNLSVKFFLKLVNNWQLWSWVCGPIFWPTLYICDVKLIISNQWHTRENFEPWNVKLLIQTHHIPHRLWHDTFVILNKLFLSLISVCFLVTDVQLPIHFGPVTHDEFSSYKQWLKISIM